MRQVREELNKEINRLKDELRTARTDAEMAKMKTDTIRSSVIAELSETHKKELAEVQRNLDARTEELLTTKEELSALKLERHKEQKS